MVDSRITYPYLPEGRTIKYVNENDSFMQVAKKIAKAFSLDATMSGGAIVVIEGIVVGVGSNGSDYHKKIPAKESF